MTTDLVWRFSAGTDVGRVRGQNEDAFGANSPPGLFIVADGMGGHAAGEVASTLAVRCASEGVAMIPAHAPVRQARIGLQTAIADANEVIRTEGRSDPERAGMGTTATALLLSPDGWWLVGHVGDSRAYLVRGGEVRQITRDHTYVQELVNEGRLTVEEARVHPRSSLLTRALGTMPRVPVDLFEGEVLPGDRFVLASDGLMAMVPDQRIRELLLENTTPDELVGRLIQAANEAGGHDNITAIVIDAVEGEAEADPAAGTPS